MRDTAFARRMEAVADIALIAGANTLDSDDSRADIAKMIELAEEFEQHRVCPPDGEETYFGKPYMEAIEEFARKKFKMDDIDASGPRRVRALRHFLEIWTDGHFCMDIGPRLSCTECNALADLFNAHELYTSAESLLEGHAAEDEEGDDPEHLALRDRMEDEGREQNTVTPIPEERPALVETNDEE